MKPKTALILVVGLLIFGIFFWPGLYQYIGSYHQGTTEVLVRVNRLSGTVEIFHLPEGWVQVRKPLTITERLKRDFQLDLSDPKIKATADSILTEDGFKSIDDLKGRNEEQLAIFAREVQLRLADQPMSAKEFLGIDSSKKQEIDSLIPRRR